MMPAHVTKHAVRRYAERVLGEWVDEDLNDLQAVHALAARGVDVPSIYDRIHQVCDRAVDLGAVAVKADNVRLILRDSTVVSVVPKGSGGTSYGRNLQ